MKRGDIVIAAPPGAYGKPRPVLIVQDDAFALPSVTVLPFTSDLQDAPLFRLRFVPDAGNGLQKASDLMVDKAVTLPREKIGQLIGHADGPAMRAVGLALARFLSLPGGRS
ncbi:MAG: type II toxin-antitoxin system PemK/MazF family toxin [Acetobacteraceae bacterium]|nr:type II toxin-antitoxin system PemK/MazF family toxin [Acetobacteraceae bacterium]